MDYNKTIPIMIILFSLIATSIYYLPEKQELNIEPVNYKALFMAGMVPTTPSRAVTQVDIDTGLRLNNNGEVLALYESRNWNTLDYGKTFLVRVA